MTDLFDLRGKTAVVTGGTGVLGGVMAFGLAQAGVRVGVLGRSEEKARRLVGELEKIGEEALALQADILQKEQLEKARDSVLERWGCIDILVNAAGGNVPEATLDDEQSIFDLPEDAFREVFDLNLMGTLLPSQVFGGAMVRNREAGGSIVNISSMAADRTITRVAGYSTAKAAVENFTRWLAVDLARRHGDGLRVNAISPGFFIGEQNRALLMDEEGSLTERGRTIVDHTPAGRFGEPEELIGTLLWLCSPGAGFVTGVVVPVDGGFSAFSGV